MKIEEIIEVLGGEAQAAASLDVHQTTVQYWIRSGSLPKKYWEQIIKLTKGKITADILLKANL